MFPPKDSTLLITKPIAKFAAKSLKFHTKRKHEKTSKPFSKQIREA